MSRGGRALEALREPAADALVSLGFEAVPIEGHWVLFGLTAAVIFPGAVVDVWLEMRSRRDGTERGEFRGYFIGSAALLVLMSLVLVAYAGVERSLGPGYELPFLGVVAVLFAIPAVYFTHTEGTDEQ